jgi:DNA-binding protein HU-beta
VPRLADYTGGKIVVRERKGGALGVPRGEAAIGTASAPAVITEPVANRRSRGYSGALIWENTMNNTELAETLVANHNLSKADARKVVDDLMAAIVEVSLSGFGKFKIKDSPAREGRNPSNGETIQIAASKKLTFVPAKAVKDALNG